MSSERNGRPPDGDDNPSQEDKDLCGRKSFYTFCTLTTCVNTRCSQLCGRIRHNYAVDDKDHVGDEYAQAHPASRRYTVYTSSRSEYSGASSTRGIHLGSGPLPT